MSDPASGPATPPSRAGRPRLRAAADVLLVALTCALAGGVAHASVSAVRRYLLDQFIFLSRDFGWMIPASFAMLVVAAALPVVPLAAAFPRLLTPRRLVLGFAAATAMAVLLPYTQIARYAAALLALGAGVQFMWLTPADPARARRTLLRLGGVLSGVVVVTAVVTRIVVRRAEQGSGAAAASESSAVERPNVLFIILDTVRAANLSLYGYPRPTTPGLSYWMKGGVVFDRAFAPAPWTLPSHGAMFTGWYGGELSGDWKTPLDRTRRTLAEEFRDAGWATGAFAANVDYTTWESGLQRGFGAFRDYNTSFWQAISSSPIAQTVSVMEALTARSPGQALRALLALNLWIDPKHWGDRTTARDVTDHFLHWQAGLAPRAPFFAFLNYFDAHGPYDPEPPQRSQFAGNRQMDLYDAAIATIDHHLDRLLGELKARDVLDRTIVVVASDHGELFGEHGLWGHAHNMYRNVLHVPLAIRGPGVPPNASVAGDVSLVDLPATILDLAGLRPLAPFPGASLAVRWAGGTGGRDVLAEVSRAPNIAARNPASRGPMKALVRQGLFYIRNGDGVEELYDDATDSAQVRDLASTDTLRLRLMRSVVDSILARRGRSP